MNTIVIDCGASFIKGALIQNGRIVKQRRQAAPVVHGKETILQAIQIQELIPVVRGMIVDLSEQEKEVKLCISNEMHGFLLAYEDGTPYTDYISWQKEYGAVQIKNQTAIQMLNCKMLEKDILHTGMPLRAGLPSCNLMYLAQKKYLQKAESKLYFYTLGDYILKAIAKSEPICHPTNAAATGLYDLHTGTWNHKLIKVVGAEDIIFPKIGEEKIDFNLELVRMHALPAIGDQQAALLGAGLNNQEVLSFNLGTGAQISKMVSAPLYGTEYQIRPYFYGQYLKTVPFLPSGRALNVYIRFFKDILRRFQVDVSDDVIWKVLLEAEIESTETDLSCDLSFFQNAVTQQNKGSITNIGEYSLTVDNLMHAIFSRMEKNFIWAADIVENDVSKVKRIIFSGGVAGKIEKIRKSILKHYNKDVEVEIVANETLWGLYSYGKGEGK